MVIEYPVANLQIPVKKCHLYYYSREIYSELYTPMLAECVRCRSKTYNKFKYILLFFPFIHNLPDAEYAMPPAERIIVALAYPPPPNNNSSEVQAALKEPSSIKTPDRFLERNVNR